MDYFEISGGSRLEGEISALAAKNVVLPMIACSLLAGQGETVLHNVPNIADVRRMLEVVRRLGAVADFDSSRRILTIDAKNVNEFEAPYDLVSKMRASFLVLGPLLARFGLAKVSQPGGCAIGARPIDQHVKGFAKLGAAITEQHGYTIAKAERLHGATIYFDRPTHTGTENVIMAAVLADGNTTIVNAAQEPEVADLANMLNLMGAKITGAGSSGISIEGVETLHGVEYEPIGDRLEAGTYLFAALSAGGHVRVNNIVPEHLAAVLCKIEEMGFAVATGDDWLELDADKVPAPVDIITDPFPGVPTDLQPMAMAVLCRANGTSIIWERIFENRFIHVMELQRLGANVTISGDRATIVGVSELNGAKIMASDIRAGAGLALSALAAKGETIIQRVYHIDRGYEHIETRLAGLGAKIVRKS